MDIKQLTYFIQIATDQSYSVAAKKLYISQPALSKVVKNLEQELGVKLFYFSGRKTKLTDDGSLLFEKSKKLVEDFNEILSMGGNNSMMETGHVAMGIPPILGSCFLVDAVMAFQKLYPNIDINLVEKGAHILQQEVFLGLLDIGCVLAPVYSDQFDIASLVDDESVLLVHRDHPLAERKSVTLDELKEERFVIFNEDFTLYHKILSGCRDAGFEPNIAVTSSQWDFLVELVSQNYGISILPRPILMKYHQPNIRMIRIEHGGIAGWNIVIISRKDRYMSSACHRFIDYLCENIHPFPGRFT